MLTVYQLPIASDQRFELSVAKFCYIYTSLFIEETID